MTYWTLYIKVPNGDIFVELLKADGDSPSEEEEVKILRKKYPEGTVFDRQRVRL